MDDRSIRKVVIGTSYPQHFLLKTGVTSVDLLVGALLDVHVAVLHPITERWVFDTARIIPPWEPLKTVAPVLRSTCQLAGEKIDEARRLIASGEGVSVHYPGLDLGKLFDRYQGALGVVEHQAALAEKGIVRMTLGQFRTGAVFEPIQVGLLEFRSASIEGVHLGEALLRMGRAAGFLGILFLIGAVAYTASEAC